MSEQMDSVKYTLAQLIFWISFCACTGFAAVYLQYYGISNTVIGMITGTYTILSIVAQYLCAALLEKTPFLTVKKLMTALMIVMSFGFAWITFFDVPILGIVLVFITVNSLTNCMMPLINAFGMEYVNAKRNVNFGLARGFGALGWGVSAIFIGLLISHFTARVVGYIYVVSAIGLFSLLMTMEDVGVQPEKISSKEKEKGIFLQVFSNRTFLLMAVGLLLCLIGHAVSGTYSINIVKNVGGSETALGLVQFFGSSSEMIAMLLFSRLIRKHDSTQIIMISSIAFVIRFVILLFSVNLPMVILAYAMQGPSTGLCIPAAVHFVNEQFSEKKRTQGQTIFNIMTNGISACIGNVVGGWMQDYLGLHITLMICICFSFLGSICIISGKIRTPCGYGEGSRHECPHI